MYILVIFIIVSCIVVVNVVTTSALYLEYESDKSHDLNIQLQTKVVRISVGEEAINENRIRRVILWVANCRQESYKDLKGDLIFYKDDSDGFRRIMERFSFSIDQLPEKIRDSVTYVCYQNFEFDSVEVQLYGEDTVIPLKLKERPKRGIVMVRNWVVNGIRKKGRREYE